ncbi:MAG: hypothetical protein LBG80_08915, partial [Bacteroidales bacterium]|nr:hypothetical protein [Bacteroidales bacterium]
MRLLIYNFILLLKRFRTSSILNILGLAIAFATFFVIIIQSYYDINFDRNFKKADDIYLVSAYSDKGGLVKIYPHNIGHVVVQFPEIKNFCCIKRDPYADYSVFDMEDAFSGGKHKFKAKVTYISESFIDMFTPEIIAGDVHQMFTDDRKAMLPESVTRKFFGNENPVGQVFYYHEQTTPLTVVAVYKDFPENCSLKNEIYFAHLIENDPNQYMLTIYIEISPDDKNQMLNKIRSVEQRDKVNFLIKNMELIALPDVHFKFPVEGQISRTTTWSLLAIGILLMIIAYINFINFSISMAPSRLKNFNIRRIFGEHPLFLKFSIAMETVFISIIALLLSLLFVNFLNNGVIKEFFQADLSPANNTGLLLAFASGAVVMGFLVGMYPAFYSTHFKPAIALSGSFTTSSGAKILKNTLIVIQFAAAIFLITTAGFIKIQHSYMQTQTGNWGEESKKGNIVLIKNILNSSDIRIFESELRKNPDIIDITYSSNLTGDDMLVLTGSLEGNLLNYILWIVDHNFFNFFGVDIIEGRDFREGEQDKLIFNQTFLETNSFVFNNDLFNKFVEVRGLGNPIMAETVGISKDFNFQPLREPIKPIAFIEKQWRYGYMYVKVISENSNNALAYIDNTWQKFSDKPIDIVFLDKWFNSIYDEENNLAKLISIFGLITMIVSIMGVYGLILFNAKSKRKTIALHKVHGASIMEVILMLNRGFLIQFAVAYIIAVPVA